MSFIFVYGLLRVYWMNIGAVPRISVSVRNKSYYEVLVWKKKVGCIIGIIFTVITIMMLRFSFIVHSACQYRSCFDFIDFHSLQTSS